MNIQNLKIALFQMNTITGDLNGNFNKAKDFILKSIDEDADIIVLPETCISGYCCGALFENIDFIREQEDKVLELSNLIPPTKCLVIGYVSYHGIKKTGFPRIKNSALVVNNNKMYRYDKQYLTSDNHQEDKRYFEEGDETKVFKIKLKFGEYVIGVPICEDVWYKDHNRDIPKEMVDLGAQMIISLNQSYFYYGKTQIRKELINRFEGIPFIYLNSCGIGDIVKNIIIFDGGSLIWNGFEVSSEFPKFQEFNISLKLTENIKFNNPEDKYDEIIEALCFAEKNYMELCGIEKAQVHLSGGLDSSIVAALTVKAVGKDKCVFITNPSSLNGNSIKLARQTAKKLGVHLYENPIQEIYEKVLEVDQKSFNGMELNLVGKSTIQALLRTVQGFYNCHRFKSAVINSSNMVEDFLGFYSICDVGVVGLMQIIGDLTKIELYEISKKLNELYGDEIIPSVLFNGIIKPAAELPDSNIDPIDYYIQSFLVVEILRYNKSKRQLINEYINKKLNLDNFPDSDGKNIYELYTLEQFITELDITILKSRKYVFKAAMCSPIVLCSPRSRGFSSRETIINKYVE